jgi:N-acetylglucosamine-6-sulfatase
MDLRSHAYAFPLTKRTKVLIGTALATLGAVGCLVLGVGQRADAAGPGSPNIIFFLTDDQTFQELATMPQTNQLLTNAGVQFTRAYDSYPLCCPSRATFLTGQYMHNHGVRGNTFPAGGAEHFHDLGEDAQDLPVRLKAAGYYTAHIGKYLNGYGGGDACGPGDPFVPPGWDDWHAKMAATNGACSENNYYQYSLYEKNGPADPTPEVVDYGSDTTDYQTDVYRDKALTILDARLPSTTPLYMEVDFGAPHGPFEPAPRHKFTLSSAPLPALPGFNEKNISDKPSWLRLKARHRLTASEKANINTRRRRRMEMLLSVDEAIAAIVNNVSSQGELANTYFVFTSDNGFFNGEHRIGSGKYLPYEPSSHVPLVIRGPGIPTGQSAELVDNADYMPTVLQIAGATASPTAPVDGRSMLPYATNPVARSTRPILLEGDVGPGLGPGQNDPDLSAVHHRLNGASKAARLGLNKLQGVSNLDEEPGFVHFAVNGNIDVPAFKGIRTNRYAYYIYATGDQELYDMPKDPGQLNNVAFDPRYKKVRNKLYRKLFTLAFCQGDSCRADYGPDPRPLKKHKKHKKSKTKKKGR